MGNDSKTIDSDEHSCVWEDLLEDDDMISQEEGEADFGVSCNDFNWDQQSTLAMSELSIYFDMQEKDDVSELDTSTDERSTDSTIVSVKDWFSIDTEIEVEEPITTKQAYSPDTIGDAIRREKREQRRSAVLANMLRLESSMQKLGLELGEGVNE